MWGFVALAACSPKTPPAAPAPEAAPAAPSELGATLDDWLSRFEPFGFSGVVLVAQEDRVVLREAYGQAVRGDGGRAMTPDTPLVLGSLSKPFTATAILALAEDGELALTDPVSRFFPDAPAATGAITVEQLLTHTSGLPYLAPDFLADVPRAAVMAEVLGLPLEHPGTYAYSSPGYTLLAGVVEAASGRSFEEVLRTEVLDPAGATGVGFLGEPRWATAPQVHAYTDGMDEGPLAGFPALAKGVGAGTLVATVDDLYRLHAALRSGAIVPAARVEEAFAAHVPQGPPGQSFGYGWNVIETPRGRVVAHAGDLGGYNTDLRWYPDRDLLVICLSNSREDGVGWRQAVMNDLSLLVAGEPHLEPPRLATLPDGQLTRWAGRYVLPADGAIEARVDGDALVLAASDQPGMALLAGMSPEAAARAAELDARTSAIVEAAARGDDGPLREALSPSLPYDAVSAGLAEERAAREARLGPFEGVEVVGTVVRSPRSAETWFRLRHARGADLARYAWVGDTILGLETELPEALPTRFLPESDEALVAFDPFARTTVRVWLTEDGLRFEDGTVAARAG